MNLKLNKIQPRDRAFYETLLEYFEIPEKDVFCFLAFDIEDYYFSKNLLDYLNHDNDQIKRGLKNSIEPVYEDYVERLGRLGVGERRRYPRLNLKVNNETKPFVSTKLIDFTVFGFDFVLFLLFPPDLFSPENISENTVELIYKPSQTVGVLDNKTVKLSNTTALKLEDINVKLELEHKGEKVLFFENPKSSYFNEFIKDFSEILKSRDEQIHYRELLTESVYSGFWDWDISTNYEYLSPQFKAMFGYDVHEMQHTPESWQKIAYEEDLPKLFAEFEKHVSSRGAKPFSSITRFFHKNGQTKYVLCSGRVVEWDEDWKPKRAIGTHVDLTEQFETRKQLDQKNKEANNIFSFSNSLFFLIDKNGTIVWNSPNIKDILNTSHDELNGDSILTLLDRDEDSIESFIQNKVELNFPLNGRWYEVFATDISHYSDNERDNRTKYFFQLQDITERKKAEHISKKNLEKEEKLLEQQKVFLSASSHILRTPLSVINTNIEIVNEKLKSLGLSDDFVNIETIQNQVKKINDLISDMTEFTNVKERKKSKINTEEMIDLIEDEACDHNLDVSSVKKQFHNDHYIRVNKVNLLNILKTFFTLINSDAKEDYSCELHKVGDEIQLVSNSRVKEGFHKIVKKHFNEESKFDIDHMSSKTIELQFKFEFLIELINIEQLKFNFKEIGHNSVSYKIAFNLYEN